MRLSKLPAVTISAIRGRARGAGSEFVLATDIRFASREREILAQMEVGFGGEDFDGELAERYRYINRAVPDAQFEDFVDRFARGVSNFDRDGLMVIKHFINQATLPSDAVFPPQLGAFFQGATRPDSEVRLKRFFDLGLQQRSDVELRLGEYVGPSSIFRGP